jgi:hypothetical protein
MFSLTAWKIAIKTAQQKLLLKVKKPVEAPIYT